MQNADTCNIWQSLWQLMYWWQWISTEPRQIQNQHNECAPSEDSYQPGHPPSLIRVFAVRLKKAWVFSYPLSASKDSDRTGRMPRLTWVFAGRTVTLLVFFMLRLSCSSGMLSSFILCWVCFPKLFSVLCRIPKANLHFGELKICSYGIFYPPYLENENLSTSVI